MEFERRRYGNSYLNIAPLVDVVFLLLLFFMLASRMVSQPVVDLNLPESKTATDGELRTIDMYVSARGGIRLNGKVVALRNLSDNLKVQDKSLPLYIHADRDVTLQLLISVIDEIRKSGRSDFSIVTTKRNGD
ncbi:MAG: hypothetical protein D6726_01425 [Nitrospirae bacterium]|nr:MAG: hypothetical protein D6726_01425 [Nitrospirota bacterium]